MRRPRVAFVMDHPQRDLAGLVLTAVELCQQGVDCQLVPLNLLQHEIWALAPDFVVLNFLRRGNETLARRLLEVGIPFGLLDTEGVVWADFQTYTELLWPDRQLLHRTSRVCAWGPELAGHLVREGYLTAAATTVTGCPRFDLYHHQWRSVLQNGDRSESRPRILINTNFPTVNPRFGSVANNVEMMRGTFGWTESRIETALRAEEAAMTGLIEIARDLRSAFPGAAVVVRPHPHENPTPYRQRLADVSDVEINDRGPVHAQLFRAAVVIQRNCTTAIDAGFAQVPSVSPQWLPSWFQMELSERVSMPVGAPSELRDVVAATLDGSYAPDAALRANMLDVIQRWFHRADGEAYRRVSAALLPHLEVRDVNRRASRRHLYGVGDEPLSKPVQWGRRTRHALSLPVEFSFRRLRPAASDYWERSDKFFDDRTVLRLVDRIQRVRAERGLPNARLAVAPARQRNEYLRHDFLGHTVTLARTS
jgi:surface carbohydrate biosynthesis protein